ncbi:MAG: hypothetical protein GY765_22925, partial [bacterium]|nr:hypothetical protein [bacterium]
AGKLAQMDIFYDILQDAEAVTEICKYNVTVEALEAGRQLVLDAQAADIAQQKAIEEAKDATAEKNRLYGLLRAWVFKFHGIARLVFRDSPRILDKIDSVVPYLRT